MISLPEAKALAFALALSGLVVWHYTDRHAAVEAAKAAQDAQWTRQFDKATAAAKADHDEQQRQIDALRKSSAPEIKAKVDSIAATLAKLKDQPTVKYLPANCTPPPEFVTSYNSIK